MILKFCYALKLGLDLIQKMYYSGISHPFIAYQYQYKDTSVLYWKFKFLPSTNVFITYL